MPLFWFALGAVFGGVVTRTFYRPNTSHILGNARAETEAILDGIGRLHRTGAIREMDDLRLRHGSPQNNVQLLIRPRRY